jgi:hypothetical protein
MDKLIEFLQRILDWLLEALLWLPRKMYELVTDGLGSFIEGIPVPEFMQNLSGWVSGLDPTVAYFAAPLHIGAGLGILIAAYIIRFLIRRVPLIG